MRVLIALGAWLAAGCGAASEPPPPRVQPIERVVAITPGAPVRVRAGAAGELTLQLRVASGYHVMSDRPSAPQYIPTRVVLEPAADLSFEPARFPASQAFRSSDGELATFAGAVAVSVPLRVASGAAAGVRDIAGSVSYQACTEGSCLFPTSQRFVTQLAIDP